MKYKDLSDKDQDIVLHFLNQDNEYRMQNLFDYEFVVKNDEVIIKSTIATSEK